jgi:hypothetical protein
MSSSPEVEMIMLASDVCEVDNPDLKQPLRVQATQSQSNNPSSSSSISTAASTTTITTISTHCQSAIRKIREERRRAYSEHEKKIAEHQARVKELNTLKLDYQTRLKAIQVECEVLEGECAILDDERDNLEAQSAVWQRDRSVLMEEIHQLNMAAAPCKLLSDETLSHIFSLTAEENGTLCWACKDSTKAHASFAGTRKTFFPELVCSKWRQVAIKMPVLWRKLHLEWKTSDTTSGYHRQNLADFTSEFVNPAVELMKRGTTSLSVILDTTTILRKPLSPAFSSTLRDSLTPISHQLTSLDWNVAASEGEMTNMLAKVSSQFPKLTDFKICFKIEAYKQMANYRDLVLEKTGSSYQCVCGMPDDSNTEFYCNVDWKACSFLNNLRAFDAGQDPRSFVISAVAALELLWRCPRLEELSLAIRTVDRHSSQDNSIRHNGLAHNSL